MTDAASAAATGHFSQLGYVVRDLDRAIEMFATRRGVTDFSVFSGPIPAFGRKATLRVALAYAGEFQIELIQPPLDVPTIYTDSIPPDLSSARLHHICMQVENSEEWSRVQQRIAEQGMPIAIQESLSAVNYAYVDTRAESGHYTEYVLPSEEGRAWFASIPRNPLPADRTGRFYQLGYVVRDMERAIETFSQRRGIGGAWKIIEGPVPAYGRNTTVRTAHGQAGPIEIELIQPPLDIPSIYTHAVPPDDASARLHHIGLLVEDAAEWERVERAIHDNGAPVGMRGSVPQADYAYVDTRTEFGHYTEYVWRH